MMVPASSAPSCPYKKVSSKPIHEFPRTMAVEERLKVFGTASSSRSDTMLLKRPPGGASKLSKTTLRLENRSEIPSVFWGDKKWGE